MKLPRLLLAACCALLIPLAHAERITVAAAADLKFAMQALVNDFKKTHPSDDIVVVYGSSGNFYAQIQQSAPFDLFFSADIELPRALANSGLAASPVQAYAVGRIVLWSATLDAAHLTLMNLIDPNISRIAIANPKHAPYGKRAEEALRATGIWTQVQPKLIYGENVAQAAQFAQTGNAQVGIIALSLALSTELSNKGGYSLIPDTLHEPLEQGFIITQRAAGNILAKRFADYIGGNAARSVLARHGFSLPGDVAAK